MHRKLIHTFRALGLVLSLATAVLITVAPAPGVTNVVFVPGVIAAPATVAPQAMAGQAIAEHAVTGQAKPRTGSAKANSRHRRAQAREAMALPFFSFAQGLRSGNRS